MTPRAYNQYTSGMCLTYIKHVLTFGLADVSDADIFLFRDEDALSFTSGSDDGPDNGDPADGDPAVADPADADAYLV